jgi:hypothetical protein
VVPATHDVTPEPSRGMVKGLAAATGGIERAAPGGAGRTLVPEGHQHGEASQAGLFIGRDPGCDASSAGSAKQTQNHAGIRIG